MDDEQRFWWMELDKYNLVDLDKNIEVTESNQFAETALFGIVDERDGGIIAYAIGEAHANLITDALRVAYEKEVSNGV